MKSIGTMVGLMSKILSVHNPRTERVGFNAGDRDEMGFLLKRAMVREVPDELNMTVVVCIVATADAGLKVECVLLKEGVPKSMRSLPHDAVAEIGDEVFILQGGKTPFVMRNGDEGTYRLMGPCYLWGAMKGERLRHGWQHDWKIDSNTKSFKDMECEDRYGGIREVNVI